MSGEDALTHAENPRTILLTLVHGTFARNARWARPGSTFRRALEHRFGARLRFDDPLFKWNGGHFFISREKAARMLRERLAGGTAIPDRVHVIVGHSHGGNVAIQAVRSGAARLPIDGVACLGTPFIHVSQVRRCLTTSAAIHVATVGFLLLVSFAAFIIGSDSFGPPVQDGVLAEWSLRNRAFVGATMLVALAAAVAFIFWGRRIAESRLRTHAQESAELPPLLIVRAPSDEASALLGLAQLTSWLMPHSVVGVSLLLVWGTLFQINTQYSGRAWSDIMGFLIGVPLIWGVLMLYLLVFVGLVTSFFFGPDAFFGVFSHRISVESTPPGTWTVHCIKPKSTAASGWRHSVYEETEVTQLLCDWLESLAGKSHETT